MNFLSDVVSFLTDGANWHGDEGIPTLVLQHLQLTVVSVAFAALIAVPIGVFVGHVRRGGAVAVNVATRDVVVAPPTSPSAKISSS